MIIGLNKNNVVPVTDSVVSRCRNENDMARFQIVTGFRFFPPSLPIYPEK